jgi:hypothetical protein
VATPKCLYPAADAAFLPSRPEHEVLDEKLAAPGEQVGKCFPAVRPLENIGLVDLLTQGRARRSVLN